MTSVLKVDPAKISFDGSKLKLDDSQTIENLKRAAEILHRNNVVAFPTETVYGLGANCMSTEAVSKIYEAKNRPADNPLIIHASSPDQIKTILKAEIPEIYKPLVERFWPGPLTVLLPLPEDSPISPLCSKGQQTFGCRIPAHPVARALIYLSGLPLAAPSANASTKPSCTEAQHVLEDLDGRIELILDGGSADVGVESTVIDGLVSPPCILRPGGVSLEDIKLHGGSEWQNAVTEATNKLEPGTTVRAPGMKYKHYSPKAKVIIVKGKESISQLANGEYISAHNVAVLSSQHLYITDFQGVWPASTNLIDLPLGQTKKEVSHNLFSRFREADLAGADLIVVEAVDTTDEGLAIMNRLNKAAVVNID